MKKSKSLTLLAIFAVLTFSAVYAHQKAIDGLPGQLLSILGATDTEYTEGYSDSGFKKIEEGQTPAEVIEILGLPFNYEREKGKDSGRWMYSRSPSSIHYSYREVRFKNGVVSEVDGHFYID